MITGTTPKGDNEEDIKEWIRFVPIEPVDFTCLGENAGLVSNMVCDIRERWSSEDLLKHPHFQKIEKEFQHDLELRRCRNNYRLTEDLKKQMYAEHEKRMNQKVDKEAIGLVDLIIEKVDAFNVSKK